MRVVLALIVSFAALRAAAASPESERLFHDGKALLAAGKLPAACDAFARSQALAPAVGTLLNLADCRERQGETAAALALFREARSLASRTGDAREAEAIARVAALESTLAPVNEPVNEPAIERTDPVVGPAVALVEAPIVVAHAGPAGPAAQPAVGEREDVPPPVRARAAPPSARPLGLGLQLGATERGDALYGVRVLGSLAVPGGALRATGSFLYTETQIEGINDFTDSDNTTKLSSFAVAVDYVWRPSARFAFAAGLGVGRDHLLRVLDEATADRTARSLRASPLIVSLGDRRVEVGLHLQVVSTIDHVVVQGGVAVDVFPL